MIAARRQPESCGGAFEQRQRLFRRPAVPLDLTIVQPSVGGALPGMLQLARTQHSLRDGCARLDVSRFPLEDLARHTRDLDMQIKTIKQRPGQPRAITIDLLGRASAFSLRIAQIAARARIHGRDELKRCREFCVPRRTRHSDHTALQRLAQDFERATVELGKLIEKQHAVVSERDFTRTRLRSAADERYGRGRVMRTAVWTHAPFRWLERQPRDAAHCGYLQRFALGQRRQQARQPLRQHALAGTRRTDHQQAVLAGRRNLERALGVLLTPHFIQIAVASRRSGWARRRD